MISAPLVALNRIAVITRFYIFSEENIRSVSPVDGYTGSQFLYNYLNTTVLKFGVGKMF